MPPNKKAQKNAFYYYMIDLMAELKNEGYNFPNGLTDVVPIAGPKWKHLTQFERIPYEEMAQKAKNKKNSSTDTKKDLRIDSTGMLISQRLESVDELNRRFREQEEKITGSWAFQPQSELLNTKFCFINFQTMCKTFNGEYLPMEMAVVEYSMNDGIIEEFCQFINPIEIPVGYRYEAQLHSDSTHKIPIENFELAQSNYHEMWLKLVAFSEEAEFFCLSKDFEETEFCLNWIRYHSGVNKSYIIKLYALEKLVMDLFKTASYPVAKCQILDMLTTTAFDYEPNTRCAWHEEKGIIHCSLAIIRRFAYAMSDSLTNVYNFNLTARHLPVKDQKTKGITLNRAQFKSRKSVTFRQNLQRSSASPPVATTHTSVSSSVSSDDDDDDDDKSEPELETLRKPDSEPLTLPSWNRHPGKNSFLKDANFPSLDQGIVRSAPGQSSSLSATTTTTSCWQRPPQDILKSVYSNNNHSLEAPRPHQSTSLAAATLNTISPIKSPSVPAGAWARPHRDHISEVAPSLENFPTLSSAVSEDKISKSGRRHRPTFGGHNNNCFTAGRGRGRAMRSGVNPNN